MNEAKMKEKRVTTKTLYEECLKYLAENLTTFCVTAATDDGEVLCFKDRTFKLNNTISEDLIEKLSERNKLNDLSITLFTSKQTCLKTIKIKNAYLKKASLKVFSQHCIHELLINHLTTPSKQSSKPGSPVLALESSSSHHDTTTITINDLIDAFNEETRANLRTLDLSHNTTLFTCIMTTFKTFQNLVKLNVSYTYFNNVSLDVISQYVHNLEYLDMSATRVCDLQPLLRLKATLKYLLMYNLKSSLNSEMIPIIGSLRNLIQLDLSKDVPTQLFADLNLNKFDVNKFLTDSKDLFQNLQILDISAQTDLNEGVLMSFLESRENIKFLGLALTNANTFTKFLAAYNNKFTTTGEATQEQLTTCLKYYKTRQTYIQKALFSLFNYTTNIDETKQDLVEEILQLMKMHLKSQSIQIAATACVYNLTRQHLSAKVQVTVLNNLVEIVLQVMEYYPNTLQIQKNCLFILRNGKILRECKFNRFLCVKLALNNLFVYNDLFLTQSAVSLCSLLAYHIEPSDLYQLGDVKYISKLLSIIQYESINIENSALLEATLNALWSLTDESDAACTNFINENGVSIYANLMEKYQNNAEILTKILGLINNIAEMKSLRGFLLDEKMFGCLSKLLTDKEMRVNYFVSGAFAHLFSDLDLSWDEAVKARLIAQMESVICSWEEFESGLGFYRSFEPFLRLIDCSHTPVAQLWATWAITIITKRDPTEHCDEIKRKNIVNKMERLNENSAKETNLHKMSSRAVQILKEILSERDN